MWARQRNTDRALVAAGWLVLLAACTPAEVDRGSRLYAGELPLDGRVTGHVASLPTHASRCANCHAAASVGDQTAPFGTLLSRERLTTAMPRRNGPPSRFDEASFCRLLRTGVDPADIVVPRAMPRYAIDDTDCRALWAYLSRLEP